MEQLIELMRQLSLWVGAVFMLGILILFLLFAILLAISEPLEFTPEELGDAKVHDEDQEADTPPAGVSDRGPGLRLVRSATPAVPPTENQGREGSHDGSLAVAPGTSPGDILRRFIVAPGGDTFVDRHQPDGTL